MHIPSCETGQLELVPFAAALAAAEQPSEHYDVSRWLYVPNFYGEYRYLLGTRGRHSPWASIRPQRPPIIWTTL